MILFVVARQPFFAPPVLLYFCSKSFYIEGDYIASFRTAVSYWKWSWSVWKKIDLFASFYNLTYHQFFCIFSKTWKCLSYKGGWFPWSEFPFMLPVFISAQDKQVGEILYCFTLSGAIILPCSLELSSPYWCSLANKSCSEGTRLWRFNLRP